jgi:monoamine oxidase
MQEHTLPVAIIGAGPVGLAAAAHLIRKGETSVLFEAGSTLLLTGYEQVRSIVAALTGDWDAARSVELVLPETGVCSSDGGSCCTPAASSLLTIGVTRRSTGANSH